MIEDLIIIIPTHNRQHYLGRVVKYYSSFPCRVFICDSSKSKADIECGDNITYRWVPQSNFYGKVLDVLKETSADYYALSPDDDFLKQETLIECYDYLNEHNNFSMGAGKIVAFNQPFDNKLFYMPEGNRLYGINDRVYKDKLEYAKFFEYNYQNILWSLFRRKVIISAFECLAACSFENGNFIELLLGIESLRYGKIYISSNALNYTEYIVGEHWGNSIPSINKYNISTISSLRSDVKLFMQYNDGGDGFAKHCFQYYLDAPFHSSDSFIKVFIKRILPTKICTVLSRIMNKSNKTKPNIEMVLYSDSVMVERIKTALKSIG